MKVHNTIQGSDEWLRLRLGIPTASELDALVSPTGKIRTGETPHTYLATKLAERWTGQSVNTFSGGAMEQGTILESECVPWYELKYECELQRPGFITTDDGIFGCSPDGLTNLYGVEIKCPQPVNHVKWLMANECPPEHLLQCMGGMYVTGFDEWVFVSYHRSFPKLVVVVERDNELMDKIADALAAFLGKMNTEWDAMVERNGGPPKHRTRKPAETPQVFDPFAVGPTEPDFEVKV